ncbi:hypothetical protein SMGD1_1928 [Sulfurimonas gotlandica GD1]|uniref:Uncharacterized protein n=1 Tax=Sulfurimonas gotlandica (strain DSM 19862 / JCM 16533 / GD1) TaxID=929558 RepID=B6BIU1_SULGG|nr:hypothetical protein [Sulfurimonas gotlandica]EDZ63268.1 conserved hypothetical protein [Sulfurimonas gotlandica GD1]EHP30451.1 hypothetical protein SMGD1_1928 [Sulfurimonas gotlandica GD1]
MKIAVECKSPLLQKSLEIFLSSHLSSLKQCDIVVRDFKALDDDRTFYISKDSGSDLIKPFSKSALILALEKRYETLSPQPKEAFNSFTDGTADFSILEKRIDILTQEYKENILKAVRAFYEE